MSLLNSVTYKKNKDNLLVNVHNYRDLVPEMPKVAILTEELLVPGTIVENLDNVLLNMPKIQHT